MALFPIQTMHRDDRLHFRLLDRFQGTMYPGTLGHLATGI